MSRAKLPSSLVYTAPFTGTTLFLTLNCVRGQPA
jgi:hypothetical protein